MGTGTSLRLAAVFVTNIDPRLAGKVERYLVELLGVVVNAGMVGAETFVEFVENELWANEKLDRLRQHLKLEKRIPSHDTFGRLFGLIDPEEFETAFRKWVSGILPTRRVDVVVIDCKTSQCSGKVGATRPHQVIALAARVGLVLGQRATAAKSNKKAAIPHLLVTMVLEGNIVSIDTMGTRANIAKAIWDRHADYILAVKEN